MSGGDGKGHNSGAHSTGGVNGSSGKGGPSSGKGGYDGHNLGGHTTNNGNGTSTTTDNRGSVTHHNGGSSGGGVHWGGGSGHGNGGGQGGNTGNGKSSGTALAFGVPAVLGPTAGEMGFALSGEAVSAAMTEAFGLLKGPFKFGLWGVALYGILPGEIAKDDPKMMSKIVTSLPADTVTETPASTLPLQQATVRVKQRVVDVVKDERQHIAVVAGQLMSVPVVDAKPTKRPGVFSASVPGLPSLQVSVTKGVPVAKTQPKALTPEKGVSRPAGFTAGGNSHDAVIRFPKESGQKPVYVSITDVLTPAQVKQRQEEEKRRWDTAHPVEVAERELDAANKELSAAQTKYNQADKRHQAAVAGFKRFSSVNYGKEKGELATLEAKMAELNKAKADAINRGGTDPRNNGYGRLMWALQQIKVVKPQWDVKKATVTGYDKAKKELDSSTVALNSALESRKQKEKKKKDAESKLNEEKNKPRKGTKDYGHDYHPAPKTEDIKGLGDLKKGTPKTPMQGGGGRRKRWIGDKGRKIYEWDSQHGELEGYRASDGEHLGAFDPKTGKQIKGPDPKGRNIKKYL